MTNLTNRFEYLVIACEKGETAISFDEMVPDIAKKTDPPATIDPCTDFTGTIAVSFELTPLE